jgi:hypothetical protein
MESPTSRRCWVLFAALFVLSAAYVVWSWWETQSAYEELETARVANVFADGSRTESQHRREAREQVLRDLVDGRLTLKKAAARFQELISDQEQYLMRIRRDYPGCSDEEATCRELIERVRSLLKDVDPAQAVVVQRLEAELRGMQQKPSLAASQRDP